LALIYLQVDNLHLQSGGRLWRSAGWHPAGITFDSDSRAGWQPAPTKRRPAL